MDRPMIKRGCAAPAGIGTLLLLLALLIGCLPDVGPTPDPINPPTPVVPTPVAGDLFVVVMEETGERTPETASVLQGSSEFWQSLKTRGVVFRWYDDDSDDAAEYAMNVKERPGLLVFAKDGRVLFKGGLPKDTKDIDAILKRFGK